MADQQEIRHNIGMYCDHLEHMVLNGNTHTLTNDAWAHIHQSCKNIAWNYYPLSFKDQILKAKDDMIAEIENPVHDNAEKYSKLKTLVRVLDAANEKD